MKTRSDISCEKIQELLLDRNAEKLDEAITSHFDTCENCRQFYETVIVFSRSAEISPGDRPQPDPRIIDTLKRNFKRRSTTDNFLEPLLALFHKRIPVYQIMLAVFIAAIFYFSIAKFDTSRTKPDEMNFSSQTENQPILPVEFPVLPLEQHQQIGKSLAEDSLLAKFRVSIL